VHANQAAKADFEHWTLTDLGDGFVGLKSIAHGTFLTVDAASGAVAATVRGKQNPPVPQRQLNRSCQA